MVKVCSQGREEMSSYCKGCQEAGLAYLERCGKNLRYQGRPQTQRRAPVGMLQ